MERKQFTFYESFYRAVHRIKKKSDRADAYDAICAYALYGDEPDLGALSDAAAIAFELSKPNLDASRKKAENGSRTRRKCDEQTENKPEANQKQTGADSVQIRNKPAKNGEQTGNKKEKEKELELELEKEKEYECNISNLHDLNHARMRDPEMAKAVSAYMNMINPTPSQSCLEELRAFAEEMGADVVIEAFNVALDEKKTAWSYIRAILRNYHATGVRCLADVQRIREEREREKGKSSNARNTGQVQRHGRVSALGKQAIAKMLEEGESG